MNRCDQPPSPRPTISIFHCGLVRPGSEICALRSSGRHSFWIGLPLTFAFLVMTVATNEVATELHGAETITVEHFSMLQIRFGISIEIQVYADSKENAQAAIDNAFEEAKRIDTIFSDYDPDSEARLLVDLPPDQWHDASAELVFLSRESRKICEMTNGAFDVTVGPLTHLWRKTMRFKTAPNAERLSQAVQRVGNAQWDVREGAIRMKRDGMRLDFGGIAKGYALDRMAETLRDSGISSFLIDAGGDILCGDAPPDREAWRIEIEAPKLKPRQNSPKVQAHPTEPMVLMLANRAVATSGASYQSVVLNGKRYSHIVDPRTGYGVPFLANVTVEAGTGMLADALASAVSVMGDDAVHDLKRQFPGTEITIIQPPQQSSER